MSIEALNAALDRPRDVIPPRIEARAKHLFEMQSKAITGNVWDWDKAGEEIQNKWRIRAFIEDENCQ